MMNPDTRRRLGSMLVLLGAVVGVLFVAWGLWILYVGIRNADPQSEIPRWFAFVLGGPILVVGVWLLYLVRSARREDARPDARAG